jgi:hypothetical protein
MARAKPTTPAPSRRTRILRRVAQVILVAAFAGVLIGGWAYHRARAQVSDGFFDLGAQMMRYSQARHQDAPRDLMLNGQRIRFSSGTANKTAREVLDFFEARCQSVDGELMEQVETARAEHPDQHEVDEGASPVLREESGTSGYVACLDMGAEDVSVIELGERLRRFGTTGDVHDVGDARYVFVEQYEREGQTRSHFVAMWTNGSFNVNRMFPAEGDAPGRDIEGIARPPRSRRLLSSWERGEPYTISVYQTRDDEAELESFYRSALFRDGWSLLDTESPEGPRTIVAEQGDRMVTIVLATDRETGVATSAVIDAQ